jgi:alanyl-tRNA synthetase
MSIPMNEVGKDKFEFVTMGIGYKVTSELLRRENREVRLYDDKPIDHELTPLLVEIFEHVLQHVSKKLDEIPEEVEQEIAKTASWIEPLKKQMAPLEKKIRKAK